MPTLQDSFNGDSTPARRFLTATAHHYRWLLAIVAAITILGYLGYSPWPLSILTFVIVIAVAIGSLHIELTRLCIQCMEEVPADAGVRAQRQRWLLRISHCTDSRRKLYTTFGLWLGYPILIGLLDPPKVAYLPTDAFYLLFIYSLWLHHRLRPWCSYCRPWDDGGGIHEPSPDPTVKATL